MDDPLHQYLQHQPELPPKYNGTLSISQVQSTSYVPDTCTLGMAEVNSMSLSGVPGFHEDRKCDQCNVICNGEADLEFHMKTKHV